MEQTILSGALYITALLSPTPTPINDFIEPIKFEVKKEYVVKAGDSLTSIAEKEYGDKDYWTLIWNDNDEIANPNLIEKNMKLNLSTIKTEQAPELKPELKMKSKIQPKKDILATNNQIVEANVSQAVVTQAPIQSFSPKSLNETQINYLGQCESGMTATRNSGNGYYGAFQFSIGTWNSMGTGYERADLAPLEVQIDAVQRLLSRSSIFNQFPGCARKMQALGIL